MPGAWRILLLLAALLATTSATAATPADVDARWTLLPWSSDGSVLEILQIADNTASLAWAADVAGVARTRFGEWPGSPGASVFAQLNVVERANAVARSLSPRAFEPALPTHLVSATLVNVSAVPARLDVLARLMAEPAPPALSLTSAGLSVRVTAGTSLRELSGYTMGARAAARVTRFTVPCSGFHCSLETELSDDPPAGCAFALVFALPSSAFVDVYALWAAGDALGADGSRAGTWTVLDLECAAERAPRALVALWRAGRSSAVPLELRYASPAENVTHHSVAIPPPAVLVQCAGDSGWALGPAPMLGPSAHVRVPVGDPSQRTMVAGVTSVFMLVCAVAVLVFAVPQPQ